MKTIILLTALITPSLAFAFDGIMQAGQTSLFVSPDEQEVEIHFNNVDRSNDCVGTVEYKGYRAVPFVINSIGTQIAKYHPSAIVVDKSVMSCDGKFLTISSE